MRFEGGRDLERALFELKTASAKAATRRSLLRVGAYFAQAAARLAPRDTNNLAESYAVGTRLNKRQRKLSRKESPFEVYVGPTDPAGVQTEFGNQNQAATPHLRPAWDQEVRNLFDQIAQSLQEQIAKAVARAKRRAARGR